MRKHIHIIGSSPRTGTTLLNEMMVTCFAVDRQYPHERAIFRTPRPKEGELVVTKRPKDALFMDAIIDQNDDLYCIYLIRDPRDIVVSKHGDSGDDYYISLAWWKLVYQRSRKLLNHPRILVLKYEDVASHPNEVQRKIIEKFPFLEARRLHDFADYYQYSKASEKAQRAMNHRQKVTSSSVGNWQRHLPRLAGQISLYGGLTSELIEFGYESDEAWTHQLDGVEPDLQRSFSRNDLGWFFKLKMHLRRLMYSWRYRLLC